MSEIKTKLIYNPNSTESLNDRRTFGGNPDGMLNFTKPKYLWATNLWDTMEANTWFPKEVQMTGDTKDYKYLTPMETVRRSNQIRVKHNIYKKKT